MTAPNRADRRDTITTNPTPGTRCHTCGREPNGRMVPVPNGNTAAIRHETCP